MKIKPNYTISEEGCWAIVLTGEKVRSDGLSVLKETEELMGNRRLLPAHEQYTDDKMEPSKDTCRYGTFHQVFQIEMKFKKPKVKKVGPVKGIFYLIFEEEEEDSD